MRTFFAILLGASFVGAQCGNPTGLSRTCNGSQPQTVHYRAENGCMGGTGDVIVSVASAGSCDINFEELSGIGLPGTGTFGIAAGAGGYDLTKGNWNLADTSTGPNAVGTFVTCTGAPAVGSGEIDLSCVVSTCAIDDSDDVSCPPGLKCTAHLTPVPDDAGLSIEMVDAGTGPTDATVPPG